MIVLGDKITRELGIVIMSQVAQNYCEQGSPRRSADSIQIGIYTQAGFMGYTHVY